MKKRGFTLVELLAVIVILAIIALIAVPIVIHIINDSKKSSEKESINLYTDTVEKAITKKQMNNPNFNPDKCTIKTDGDLECFSGTTSLGTVKVTMKGTKPSSGTIYINEDDITYENIVLNGKTYYEKEISNATLVNDAAPSGVSIGDEYTYRVNDTDTFNFYVLSIEGDKVNLIMDRNICNDGTVNYTNINNYCVYNWYSSADNTYGPTTVMAELYAGTKDWDNVSDMIMNYTDENNGTATDMGYTSIITTNGVTTITGKPTTKTSTVGTASKPLKARLPKQSEVMGAGCTKSNGSCPVWLMGYMTYYNVSGYTGSGNTDKYSMNNNNEAYQNQIYGYWLLSSNLDGSINARSVGNYGSVDFYTTTLGIFGARPVITVPISDLN